MHNGQPAGDNRRRTMAMTATLAHRGPDGDGVWVDDETGVALGHRRLSIIDLSPAGAQPMTSSNGRYVIVYNGEFYNVDEMTALLPSGMTLRGHSDTEVFLELCAARGLEAALAAANGIFAIALWDRQQRVLHLVRDRLGVKPLYYGHAGKAFVFGSELKALTAHPSFERTLNRNALAAYLRFNCIPAPHTVWQGAHKLEAGCRITITANGVVSKPIHYWDLRQLAAIGYRTPLDANDDDLIEQLAALLSDAVRRQMVSDVPLGAFLSGGIDSSTVTALMQAQANQSGGPRVKTYTIGFDDGQYDEMQDAQAVARHLGTDHTALRVTPDDARAVVPLLPDIYDEPFADSSQKPTYLVSKLARQNVTVALSGDGGDEFFAGYRRHWWGEKLAKRLALIPGPMRRATARALGQPTPAQWDRAFSLIPAKLRPRLAGVSMRKFADILALEGGSQIYQRLVSSNSHPAQFLPGAVEPHGLAFDDSFAQDIPTTLDRMQTLDALTYLPDDILTKVDRASMAVGLEARVPLLDHRVCEFAVQLPARVRLRGGEGKWLLRRVLERHVPRSLFERPKMGFGIPVGSWIKGPLRDWTEQLLEPAALSADGLINPAPVQDMWQEHLSGRRDHTAELWTILMLQSWRERWMN